MEKRVLLCFQHPLTQMLLFSVQWFLLPALSSPPMSSPRKMHHERTS
jgi:hypothetical protein